MSKVYQGIVFSGGGAKGPFALGVMLAMQKYQAERGRSEINFFCGTSVGALNATLAAQGSLDKLTQLYQSLKTVNIIGKDTAKINLLRLMRSATKTPYHYFDNKALKKTIETHIDFDKIKNSHVLICATNYLTGELETFYISTLVDKFLDVDRALPLEKRRLRKYHRIENQEQLVEALLASTAIPFFFPPVLARGSIYIDGGIGNNTPLRQAAYFSRYVKHLKLGDISPIICVLNDPPRFSIDKTDASTDLFGVIRRTIDIFQEELVRDSVMAWERISREVQVVEKKAQDIDRYIDRLSQLTPDEQDRIKNDIRNLLGASTAATSRLDIDALVIRPSSPLLENILEFDPSMAKELKNRGVADCLSTLYHRNLISSEEHRQWVEEIA